MSDREDSQLIACLTVEHREGKAPTEHPAIRGFQHRFSFGIFHRGLNDDHDLLEDLTAKPWRTCGIIAWLDGEYAITDEIVHTQ